MKWGMPLEVATHVVGNASSIHTVERFADFYYS